MDNNKKLQSLLHLVDDPDEEVYASVVKEINAIGKAAIHPLEQLWETTLDEGVQKRIELLIHYLQFEDLCKEWELWVKEKRSVLDAMILVAKYKYPDLDEEWIRKQYKKLKQDIWLELNAYLTPLEQINVINSIVYNFYNITGHEIYKSKEDHFYIHKILENKHGNSYSIGILLAEILRELDIPLKCIQLPHQFLLGYFESVQSFLSLSSEEDVQRLILYVDPNNGMLHAQIDIDNYFAKIGEEPLAKYFAPLEGANLVLAYLQELQYFLDQYGDEGAAFDFLHIIEVVKNAVQNASSSSK